MSGLESTITAPLNCLGAAKGAQFSLLCGEESERATLLNYRWVITFIHEIESVYVYAYVVTKALKGSVAEIETDGSITLLHCR